MQTKERWGGGEEGYAKEKERSSNLKNKKKMQDILE